MIDPYVRCRCTLCEDSRRAEAEWTPEPDALQGDDDNLYLDDEDTREREPEPDEDGDDCDEDEDSDEAEDEEGEP